MNSLVEVAPLDIHYMRQALQIAQFAQGRTSPNPMVGAIVVKENKIVAQGWHRKAGTAHAEVHALKQAGELTLGATLYVTLEPCSHHGRTGPCVEAIIEAGIKKVVIAMLDPNPLVAGKGIARLKGAGIEVIQGVLSEEAAKVNEIFIKWISTNMPFVSMKVAMTLDGKIAAHTGHSQWITDRDAREYVHFLRDSYDAILVGTGTLLKDNPRLTVRIPCGGKNPFRIVVDSAARIPLDSNVAVDKLAPTLVAVTERAPKEKIKALQNQGVQVVQFGTKNGKVDLRELFSYLAKQGISSLLVEGGGTMNAALLQEGLVDKLYWFIAPKILGGINALGPVGGVGIGNVNEAIELEEVSMQPIGRDYLLSAYIRNREGRDVYRSCGGIG